MDGDQQSPLAHAEYGGGDGHGQCDAGGECESVECDGAQCDRDGRGSGDYGIAGRGNGDVHGDADQLGGADIGRDQRCDGDVDLE